MIEIVLSTYNQGRYRDELLASLQQSFTPDCRLLMRDDAEEHLGTVRSFERLLQQTIAEYVMLCDEDDIWLPDKVKNAMQSMLQAEVEYGEDVPIVVCSDMQVVDDNLHTIAASYWQYMHIRPDLLSSPKYLAQCNYVAGCTMMLNRAAVLVALPFGKHVVMHDWWIALRVLAAGGKIVRCPHVDILYRQHDANQVGASRVGGRKYIGIKLRNIGAVLSHFMQNFRQAHEVLGMNIVDFTYHRLMYLLLR